QMNNRWILLPGFLLALLSLLTLIQGQKEKQSHSFSVATMVSLVKLEQKLIDNLEEYAKAMDQKLQILRSHIFAMRIENNKGQLDAISYLSNPLNGLSLIRRLHQDWAGWRRYMEQPVGAPQMQIFDSWSKELPSKEDLQDACEGMVRIQGNYDLKIADIVGGKLQGRQYNASMSSSDVFAIGQYLFDTFRFKAAIKWLRDSAVVSQDSLLPEEISVTKERLLQLLALAHKENQSYSDALNSLDSCLELRPHDAVLLRQRREVEELIGSPLNSPSKEAKENIFLREMATACNVTLKGPAGLHCFYNFNTTPFLRLAPLKAEQVGLQPYAVLYHEALSSREITSIISIATQKMERTDTVSTKTTNSQTHHRTAKAHWMAKMTSELGQRIDRRIRDMTGFDLEESESFQIINYGIGGHYGPHYDFFNYSGVIDYKKDKRANITGDRIGTVLFYLSDVEQGGETVFPDAGYAIKPQAGTALFWYNLHTDGIGDMATTHGACPVIVGSKWVMTQWILERKQLFKRPCLRPSP
ncbi:hypothetical protein KR054_001717, partial [Drosophila jambulina]